MVELTRQDFLNIETALSYVANDMRSDYFKSLFKSTLYNVKKEEEKCFVKVH